MPESEDDLASRRDPAARQLRRWGERDRGVHERHGVVMRSAGWRFAEPRDTLRVTWADRRESQTLGDSPHAVDAVSRDCAAATAAMIDHHGGHPGRHAAAPPRPPAPEAATPSDANAAQPPSAVDAQGVVRDPGGEGAVVYEVVWLAGALERPTRLPDAVYTSRALAEGAAARTRAALSAARGLTWRPFPATAAGVLAAWVGLSGGDWIEGELQLRVVPVLDAPGSDLAPT